MSLEAIYREHHRKMVRYARKLARDWHQAEDIVQEVFCRLMGRADVTETLVYAHIRGRVLEGIRKRRQWLNKVMDTPVEEFAEAVEAPDALQPAEDRIMVRVALARLPEKHRVVVVMQARGYRGRDIARLTGLKEQVVRRLQMEARRMASAG